MKAILSHAGIRDVVLW